MDDMQTVPARHGVAVRLEAGEAIAIVNTHGTQVVDTWAFVADDLTEVMSMEHSRVENGRMIPLVGGDFFTNRREPILRLEDDDTPGIHDTIMAACDRRRYERLGCKDYHRNCADNLAEALAALGLPPQPTPSPLNLFMNIPVHPDRSLEQGAPVGKPGEKVVLRAHRACIVAMSACPQDMTPINGVGREPTDAHYAVLPARG
jgi:uncharacterized protein YcgI (DUF1989 family)